MPTNTRTSTRRIDLLAGAATLIACLAPSVSRAQAASAPSAPSYHVARTYTLGGDGGWDYIAVDTAGGRLFIARTDRIMVVDAATGKKLGEITGLNRGHGVAFDYSTNHGFATSGADSTVTMFDLKTLGVLKRTTAAVDDDAVLYDPASKRVFTFDGDANSSTVIDPKTGDRIGTIPLGGKPEFGVTDGAGKLYVNINDKGEVAEIDSRTMKVVRRWPIAPCEDPSGLALDAAHGRLISVCGNKLMAVSDIKRGAVVGTAPIGGAVDATAYDPTTGNAFASNGDGTLTVVHESAPGRFRVVQTVKTMAGARTMALDPKSHRLYTVAARTGPMPAARPGDSSRRRAPIIPGTFALMVLER